MGRSKGKHDTQRTTAIEPGTAAGRGIGLSARQSSDGSPIPGGRPHLGNASTVRQSVPVPDPRPEFRGDMAHGVQPGPGTAHERAEAMQGPNTAHDPRPVFRSPGQGPPPPVPVYVVSTPNAMSQMRDSSMRRYTVAATGGEPTHLLGTNSDRTEVMLLNEDATHPILIASTKANTGQATSIAVLPKGMASYLCLKTQGDLWAISSDSGTPTISIIEVFSKDGSQRV